MRVVIVGGGAAGLIAAITAAKDNNEVIILEKTSSLGNKLKITGKGRCNLTFAGNEEDFKENIVNDYKFMYSSFSNFSNKDVIKYFNDIGIDTKIERGGRVFPKKDSAIDVVRALERQIKKYKIQVIYNARVSELITDNNIITGVKLENKNVINLDKCIIATGGKSYSSTGSSGDGYVLLKKVGHTINEIKPALVPLKSNDRICKKLQGLSLKNVSIKLIDTIDNKEIYSDFGEMMFSHFGVTGPIILSASSRLNKVKDLKTKFENKNIKLLIDLKPALDFNTLDKRILRDFEKYTNKEFKNCLNELLPQKMIPVVINLSKINENTKVHQITKNQREDLIKVLKALGVNITGFMPIDMAIITSGGVNLKEINPKNMESKIIKRLHIAGEVLDLDAYTGGYNLQIAFSTGYAAGKNSY